MSRQYASPFIVIAILLSLPCWGLLRLGEEFNDESHGRHVVTRTYILTGLAHAVAVVAAWGAACWSTRPELRAGAFVGWLLVAWLALFATGRLWVPWTLELRDSSGQPVYGE